MDDDEYINVSGEDSDSDSDFDEEQKNIKKRQNLSKVVDPDFNIEDEEEEDDDDDDEEIEKDINIEEEDDDDEEYDDDDDDEDDDLDGNNNRITKNPTEIGDSDKNKSPFMNIEDDEDEDEEDDKYLQKFDENVKKQLIQDFHPELQSHNNDEIEILSTVVRDENGIIVDPLHRTNPFITRYEKARILGERSKQLNYGARPMVEVDTNVIDGYLIAVKEFEEKKIPFIIKRPLPNGGCEYWKFIDLEILC